MEQVRTRRRMLGEMLIEEGLLTPEQLEQALQVQRQRGGRLGEILRDLGWVTEEDIFRTLARQMGIPYLDLSQAQVDPDATKLIPETIARRYRLIPVRREPDHLVVAMADPLNVIALDDIRRITKMEVYPVSSREGDILRAIDRWYGAEMVLEDFLQEVEPQEDPSPAPQMEEVGLEDTPAVRLVQRILEQAVREGASDIHIEPVGEGMRVRIRVDGILHELFTSPIAFHNGVVSRIKILAQMDITERRAPQDGRAPVKILDRDLDLRISTLPTLLGEKVVIRILDKGGLRLRLEEMGMSPQVLERFQDFIHRPYGLILVTGPTGSGKTTTLYGALREIHTGEKNLVTIEDPVEYQLKGVNQVQVNPAAGVTFASGLRAILRQDPDVILVGEIRDTETANIAVQAALTGHLVLSTLHTNQAAGAVARLMDMGVEPFLLASSLLAVVGQRLVRRICSRCREGFVPPPSLLQSLGLNPSTESLFYRGKGCGECRNTGYAGRIGLFELLEITESLRPLVASKAPVHTLQEEARRHGFHSLRQDGLEKAQRGVTTLEEVFRVTQDV